MAGMLEEAGIEAARREAEWLLEAATGRARSELAVTREDVSEVTERRALKLAARRAAGEPLQYLTGVAGFRRLELAVGPGVFIPRPETEVVAERAMARLPDGGTLVDVGTGSGAIALAVADERRGARVYATESSPEALSWAEKNADLLGLEVTLLHCDLLEGLPAELRGGVDVIVSNPPYIATAEAEMLAQDVLEHEPHEALFAGLEGLLLIERLARDALGWLRPGAWLVLETGAEQGAKVERLLARLGYEDGAVLPDLAGRARIVEGRKP